MDGRKRQKVCIRTSLLCTCTETAFTYMLMLLDHCYPHMPIGMLGIYNYCLFRPPGPASAGRGGLYILLQGFIYLFRPPGPAAAGRVGLYILLLYFIYLFRPPGPASAGRGGLYILLLGFIYLFIFLNFFC